MHLRRRPRRSASGSKPSTSLVAATSSAPRAEPCALPVFWALGAGQAMIVRSRMKLGLSVTASAALIAAYSAGTSSRYSLPPWVQSTVLHVPAVRRVARRDVLGERDVGVVLDRDLVVVVDQGQVAELLDAGDRAGLAGHALLDVAVAAQRVDVVVERRLAPVLRVEQAALAAGGHRHPHGVADALAERAGRGLDAGGVAVLRVARGLAAPGAQRLEVLELQPPAAEEELDVERQARVAARQHEPVAARPVRVGGVVPHHLLEEQVRRGREAHRGAGVAVADLLDGVHGEHPDGVHGLVVELVPVQVG